MLGNQETEIPTLVLLVNKSGGGNSTRSRL